MDKRTEKEIKVRLEDAENSYKEHRKFHECEVCRLWKKEIATLRWILKKEEKKNGL